MSEKDSKDGSYHTYRYVHTFSSKSAQPRPIENLESAPIVSDALDVLLRTSKAGRAFVEGSLSIQNALKNDTRKEAEEDI